MADVKSPLLNSDKKRSLSRCISHLHDELSGFRRWLKWLCFDQSDVSTTCLSWFVFLFLTVVVPATSHFLLSSSVRPYDSVAQLSLSGVASLSFICLSGFVRKYGLRRFLFFDKLCHESDSVRKDYTRQFNRSLKLLFIFVVPCFLAEAAYKIWWYTSGGTRSPFLGGAGVSNLVACILELCSWFYRTMSYFLVCILFRLICHLQILRLQDFARGFQADSDVDSVLREHLRIRKQLRIISHRYRLFIMWALILITASLLASLLMTTRHNSDPSIFNVGELAVCSVSLLAGLMILLRSAVRITHKAQTVTCLSARWHVCATINSFHEADSDSPEAVAVAPTAEEDDALYSDEDLDDVIFPSSYAYTTVSYQKRQSLVSYFENNRAGVTVYGFMLDRTSLHTVFCIELSLVLWLLGKTIGIS